MELARCCKLLLSGLFALTLVHTTPLSAQAQDDEDAAAQADPLEADYKGMVGVGLIGAELGFVIPALAGADGAWPYIVFPVVGAGAGAAAGYFLLEKGDGHPELAVASLMAGMALFIPAMVITIAETSYDPETDAAAGAPPLAMRQRARDARVYAEAGPGLVRYASDGRVLLAPPAVVSRATESPQQARLLGRQRGRELQVAVLSGRF